MNFILKWAVGAATSLGLILSGVALDVFEATRGFWCWLLNPFLDLLQNTILEMFADGTFGEGGYLGGPAYTNVVNFCASAQQYVPLVQCVVLLLGYIAFLMVWIPLRFVLRMLPGVF